MTKASGLNPPRAPRTGQQAKAKPVALNRSDSLVALIDHCAAATTIADGLGEKFLSYLLAMAIQESRAALRRTPPKP